MPKATETTTTPHQVRGRLWQDAHSGLRRHKLMTKELGDTIPALGANENVERPRRRSRPGQAVLPLRQLDLVRDRVGRRDRTVLRPRRGDRGRKSATST